MSSEPIPGEVWRPVPGFEGRYDISDQGRVRRWCGPGTNVTLPEPLPLVGEIDKDGYHKVLLRKSGVRQRVFVHQLVALVFIGPCPAGKEVNHKSGHKLDNSVSNLEYVTPLENHQHAARIGLKARAHRNGSTVPMPPSATLEAVLRRYASGDVPIKVAAASLGISAALLQGVIFGRVWADFVDEQLRLACQTASRLRQRRGRAAVDARPYRIGG